MRILFTITHYNRPEMLDRLLDQIGDEAEGHAFGVVVFDDNSEDETALIAMMERYPWLTVDFSSEHGGREFFWETIDYVFDVAKGQAFDYWIHLPDDVEIVPGFLRTGIGLFNALKEQDPATVTLNPLKLTCDPRMQWTGEFPDRVLGGAAWRTQWNDCVWIADRSLGDALGWQIQPINWDYEPETSSRVGAQISKRLHPQHSMYQVGQTLMRHGDHPSLMNTEERAANPLVTDEEAKEA